MKPYREATRFACMLCTDDTAYAQWLHATLDARLTYLLAEPRIWEASTEAGGSPR